MVTDDYYIKWGDHIARYKSAESLYCTNIVSETNITNIIPTILKFKKLNK